jgi:hypothetical protein
VEVTTAWKSGKQPTTEAFKSRLPGKGVNSPPYDNIYYKIFDTENWNTFFIHLRNETWQFYLSRFIITPDIRATKYTNASNG